MKKSTPNHPSTCRIALRFAIVLLGLLAALTAESRAQNEPMLIQDVVDAAKLLPIFPDPPSGWTADKPEGETSDVSGSKITTAHRDYKKGGGDNVPIASISIIDSVANPDTIALTIESWKTNSETSEGYTKSVTIDGNPGSESYEKERKHAALRLLIANRYLLAIELQNQDPKELQDWLKRLDLKRLAAIK